MNFKQTDTKMKLYRLALIAFLALTVNYFYGQENYSKEAISITLKDGTALAANLYIPSSGVAHPTILVRTPYGKHQHDMEGAFWASNGYAVVLQDARGKWDSEGEYIPLFNEKNDGIETINWITKQPWSNGEVGLWGSSYLAYSAIVAASERPPAVKTMFIISGWLKGDKVINPGGAMHLMLNLAWILHEETQRVRSLQKYEMEELFEYLPMADVFNSIGIDSRVWPEINDVRGLNDSLTASQIDIPIFHLTGWNDFVANAALQVYQETSMNSPAQNKLLIGPWFHDQLQTDYTEVGDDDFGPESIMGREKLNRLSLEWFDHVFKERNQEIEDTPDVKVFVMGENRWREFNQWPPGEVQYQKWYLSSTEGANTLNGDGKLSLSNSPISSEDMFLFDPMNPVPTYGGANFHFFLHTIGVKDQTEIEERDDVLVFTSDVLTDTMDIIGPLEAVIHASTEGFDTDFTAKLVEVRENGYARIIEEGILRASNRNSDVERELLEPGKVYQLSIDMGATATQIPSGSRLRIEISSSNFPKYDRNPNTGEDPFHAKSLQSVKQTLYHGPKFPSYVILPVLNRSNDK